MFKASGLRSFVRQVAPPPLTRLVRRMLVWRRRKRFRPYTITRNVQGESFPFCVGDATGELWYSRRDVQSPELPFVRDHMLSPGDLVFDVGSHHGFYAVFMARRSTRVIAIEPHPHNVAVLRKNIALNNLHNVTVRQVAVGDSIGKVSLLEDTAGGGVSSHNTENFATLDVELLKLDSLAQEYGFPQMLKIDVEGFEDHALKGAAEILKRRPKIAIEVHVEWVSRYGASVREVIDLLDLDSYQVWVLSHKAEEVKLWNGEDLTGHLPPKFHLFLLPKAHSD